MINLQDIFPANDKPVNKALTALLALVAFSLPFKFLVNAFIVMALLVWFFTGGPKALFVHNRFTKILLAILGFYVLHALAFFYAQNIQESFFALEVKISFLVFPIIFFTGNYTWPQMKFFLKCFVWGCLLCCLLCIGRAAYLTVTENETYFFYERLSWFQHPSYLSMYLTFCCVAILQKNIFSRLINGLVLLFFTCFVLMLSSKTGIAIHFLFLVLVGVSHFLKKGSYMNVAWFSLAAFVVIASVIYFVEPVKQRFQNVVNAFSAETVDKTATESTAVRMLIWKEARKIMKESPFLGVSPGDANDKLYEAYRVNGLTGAYDKKLNAHSQYFQTGVGLGVVGIISLALMFAFPVVNRPRRLLLFFLLITAVNFLTESMLQTMAGSIFFGYFYALLCFDKELNPKQTI